MSDDDSGSISSKKQHVRRSSRNIGKVVDYRPPRSPRKRRRDRVPVKWTGYQKKPKSPLKSSTFSAAQSSSGVVLVPDASNGRSSGPKGRSPADVQGRQVGHVSHGDSDSSNTSLHSPPPKHRKNTNGRRVKIQKKKVSSGRATSPKLSSSEESVLGQLTGVPPAAGNGQTDESDVSSTDSSNRSFRRKLKLWKKAKDQGHLQIDSSDDNDDTLGVSDIQSFEKTTGKTAARIPMSMKKTPRNTTTWQQLLLQHEDDDPPSSASTSGLQPNQKNQMAVEEYLKSIQMAANRTLSLPASGVLLPADVSGPAHSSSGSHRKANSTFSKSTSPRGTATHRKDDDLMEIDSGDPEVPVLPEVERLQQLLLKIQTKKNRKSTISPSVKSQVPKGVVGSSQKTSSNIPCSVKPNSTTAKASKPPIKSTSGSARVATQDVSQQFPEDQETVHINKSVAGLPQDGSESPALSSRDVFSLKKFSVKYPSVGFLDELLQKGSRMQGESQTAHKDSSTSAAKATKNPTSAKANAVIAPTPMTDVPSSPVAAGRTPVFPDALQTPLKSGIDPSASKTEKTPPGSRHSANGHPSPSIRKLCNTIRTTPLKSVVAVAQSKKNPTSRFGSKSAPTTPMATPVVPFLPLGTSRSSSDSQQSTVDPSTRQVVPKSASAVPTGNMTPAIRTTVNVTPLVLFSEFPFPPTVPLVCYVYNLPASLPEFSSKGAICSLLSQLGYPGFVDQNVMEMSAPTKSHRKSHVDKPYLSILINTPTTIAELNKFWKNPKNIEKIDKENETLFRGDRSKYLFLLPKITEENSVCIDMLFEYILSEPSDSPSSSLSSFYINFDLKLSSLIRDPVKKDKVLQSYSNICTTAKKTLRQVGNKFGIPFSFWR